MDIKKLEEKIKMDDWAILEEKPLEIIKYGRRLVLHPVKWRKWEEFSYWMVLFLRHFYVVCGEEKLPETLADINAFIPKFRKALSMKKPLKHLLKMAKISGLNVRWINRNYTLFDFAELFIYLYLINISVVKKNLSVALRLIAPALSKERRRKETIIYSLKKK